MIYIIISILAGASIVVTRTINANLADRIGTFQGTLINYIFGLTFSIVFLLLSPEAKGLSGIKFHSVPLWAYLGGCAGVVVIVMSNYITSKISAFYLTLLIFIGQLFTGIILDYFSSKAVSLPKILGGILVLLGLTYNLFIDKKSANEEQCEEAIESGASN